MSGGYDPVPDIGCVLANLYAVMPHDAPDTPQRRALRRLRDELGISHLHAGQPLTWAQRLREHGWDARTAALEARVRELTAELAAHPATAEYVVPQGMSPHTAMTHLPEAQDGDVLREVVTGRQWARVAGNWVEQPGTDGTM